MFLWLCVALRVLANPLSNVFQKLLTREGADPLCVVCMTHAVLSLACLPICLWEMGTLPAAFWTNMGICTLLTVSGNALLVEAMKRSDLSVLGPINAYKSLVSLLPGMLLLGEVPGSWGLAGIGLILAGSLGLADRPAPGTPPRGFPALFRDRGIQYRFAALALSATEAVFIKRATLVSSALVAFAFWSVLGFFVALVSLRLWLDRPEVSREWQLVRKRAGTYLLLGATTGVMQLTTVYALEKLQVGYALALFQLSAIVSVLLGHRIFKEPHVLSRLAGATIMAAGAALIVLGQR